MIQKICIWILILYPLITMVIGLTKSFYTDKTTTDRLSTIISQILVSAIVYLLYYLAGLFSLI